MGLGPRNAPLRELRGATFTCGKSCPTAEASMYSNWRAAVSSMCWPCFFLSRPQWTPTNYEQPDNCRTPARRRHSRSASRNDTLRDRQRYFTAPGRGLRGCTAHPGYGRSAEVDPGRRALGGQEVVARECSPSPPCGPTIPAYG